MKWRQFISDYLRFSKKDRVGVLCLLTLIVIIWLLPRLFAKSENLFVKEDKVLLAAVDTLNKKQKPSYEKDDEEAINQYEPSTTTSFSKGELFQFDPNLLPAEGWKKLGLNERAIRTINNYRSKGGKFYKPQDLEKIWGLPPGFYQRVKEYISIAKEYNHHEEKFVQAAKPEKKSLNVNVNSADTMALIALPGIGSKLALRILNFRDKLGGFYSVDQIKETYGLADSTFQKIKIYLIVDGQVEKINLNTVTKDQLKIHPYIKWNLANAIVEYRNQHGNYKSIEDLKNISMLDENTFNKIAHYLSL
jgi:competence ComEA-like helix-hairpin-helix protein